MVERGRLSSEQAAYLSLGVLAWLTEQHTGRSVRAYMATNAEDLGKGTDVGLVLPRGRGREWVVFIDLTITDSRRVVREKINRSIEKAKKGGRYVEIVQLRLWGIVMDVMMHPHLLSIFATLRSERRTSLSPADIIDAGGDLELVRNLIRLGGEIVLKLEHRPHYQRYFKVDGRWVWELPLPGR